MGRGARIDNTYNTIYKKTSHLTCIIIRIRISIYLSYTYRIIITGNQKEKRGQE